MRDASHQRYHWAIVVTDAALDLAAMRRVYESAPFDVVDAAADPYEQFRRWFADVVRSEFVEANAAVLATASADGRPSARHVLLKGAERGGFVFFTNYGSRKAQQLEVNPAAALVFAWSPVARQVLIEGIVHKVAAGESDAYFESRPRESQLGAWASAQSTELSSRKQLQSAYAERETEFQGRPVPRPDYWGGYRLVPDRIEFWQGRPSRLHDRVCYLPEGVDGWRRIRLAP